jgi:hypothetical protein
MPERTVYRTAEAIAAFRRGRVRTELRNGRWQQPERGVVVTHNGPLTRLERLLVALSVCPPRSALAGSSALEVEGMTGFIEERPSIVLPEGARRPGLPGVTTHWSTELSDLDVHPNREPRRTRPARSVVDYASWSAADRRARVIVLAAVQQGLVRPRDIRQALTRRGTCRHRALIVESVLDAWGGIQSLPERDFDSIRAKAGFPVPTRQSVRKRRDGRCYLDIEWKEYEAACEIHGIPHLEVVRWDDDLDRANDVVVSGPRLLVFSSFAIRHRQDRVTDHVGRLLRRGGWRSTIDDAFGRDVSAERITGRRSRLA